MVSDVNVKGANHKIGGTQADGQWVCKDVTVFSGTKFTSTGTPTYTVSNYLPDNVYTYEVIVCSYATTGETAGDVCTWWVMDSSSDYSQNMGYSRTRTQSDTRSAGEGILPVNQINNVLTLKLNITGVGGGTGSNGLYLKGYRRLGGSGTPPTYYTLTINPTPADATVTFNKGTVVGNTCTVIAGTSVTYTVSKSGYATKSATVTVNSSQTVNVTLSASGIQLYGWTCTVSGTSYDVYVAGANNSSGMVVESAFRNITAKTGNVGASGGEITLEGGAAGTYSSSATYNGVTLYIYTYAGVLSNAAVGKKGLIGSGIVMRPPSSISSTQMKFVDMFGTTRTCTRKSSIDKVFTGS